MSFHVSNASDSPELPATEMALLLVEETEVVLERIVQFQHAVERVVVTSDSPRRAMKELTGLLLELVHDLQATLTEISASEASDAPVQ